MVQIENGSTARKIISEINERYNVKIPMDAEIVTHQATASWARREGCYSWYFKDYPYCSKSNMSALIRSRKKGWQLHLEDSKVLNRLMSVISIKA